MAQVIIGVDAGTTVIKSVAFSLNGEELHKSSVENAVDRPASGWAEQSMVTTWQKTAQTLSEVEDQLDD
ncbi:FGGY family carbohydrate kinase, partial [Halorubrum sp. Atlit-28R]|uniref:FGGY family carbohydrate kinase n=1 Tax=Halorubrum sp. Atlit-28R TaxID=2282129 RepID=UPI000F1A4DB0